MRKISILLSTFTFIVLFQNGAFAKDYWLVIGSYRQGPGGKPAVSGITSPSLHAIPMDSLDLCKKAGKKISNEIYKPVWNFDNRWTCVKSKSD